MDRTNGPVPQQDKLVDECAEGDFDDDFDDDFEAESDTKIGELTAPADGDLSKPSDGNVEKSTGPKEMGTGERNDEESG